MIKRFVAQLFRTLFRANNEGLTLIELLVVIIIISILSTIAIPSLLNQASRAAISVAESNISTINQFQVQYFTEYGRFAPSIDELASGVLPTNEYSYSVGEVTGNQVYNYALPTQERVNSLPPITGKVYVTFTPDNRANVSAFYCVGEVGDPQLDLTGINSEVECP